MVYLWSDVIHTHTTQRTNKKKHQRFECVPLEHGNTGIFFLCRCWCNVLGIDTKRQVNSTAPMALQVSSSDHKRRHGEPAVEVMVRKRSGCLFPRGSGDLLLCSFLVPTDIQSLLVAGGIVPAQSVALKIWTFKGDLPLRLPGLLQAVHLAPTVATVDVSTTSVRFCVGAEVSGNVYIPLPRDTPPLVVVGVGGTVDTIVLDFSHLTRASVTVVFEMGQAATTRRVCVQSTHTIVYISGVGPGCEVVVGAQTIKEMMDSLSVNTVYRTPANDPEQVDGIGEDEEEEKVASCTAPCTPPRRRRPIIANHTFRVEDTTVFVPDCGDGILFVDRCVFGCDVFLSKTTSKTRSFGQPRYKALPCIKILMGHAATGVSMSICDVSAPRYVDGGAWIEPRLRYSEDLDVTMRGSFVKGWPALIQSDITQSVVTGQATMKIHTDDYTYPLQFREDLKSMAANAMLHTPRTTRVVFTGCDCVHRRLRASVQCKLHTRVEFDRKRAATKT